MTLKDLKSELVDRGYEDSVVLENPSYIDAVVGISQNGQVIYDFDKMVDYLVDTEEMTEEDAIEFIDFNTIRALPYMGENAPIVKYNL